MTTTNQGHILIVEDNRINQTILKTQLVKLGYTIQIAENGLIALTLLNDNNFDLIFMDLQMPEMGGVECTQFIRKNDNPLIAKIPILAITANVNYQDKEDCVKVGMDDFIAKPYTRKDLIKSLKSWHPDNPNLEIA